MMTDDVDELLREAEANSTRRSSSWRSRRAIGWWLPAHGDDLPRLMAPFVAAVRQWRADAMPRCAQVRRIRLIEARIALNEALIARPRRA